MRDERNDKNISNRDRLICNYQFLITNYSSNFWIICNKLSISPEFVVYLQSIINFDWICNRIAIN